jgi:hypothetical protein
MTKDLAAKQRDAYFQNLLEENNNEKKEKNRACYASLERCW